MDASRALRRRPGWEGRLRRMLVVSAVAHAGALGLVLFLADRAAPRPLPLVAYTVELTDPSALGGRTPAGAPGSDLAGGTSAPEPKGEPAAPPPQPEAKPEPKPKPKETAAAEEPALPVPEKPTPPEPKPEAKKPEPPAPEAKKPEPPKSPEPPKPEPKKAEPPKPEPRKPEPPKPEATKPAPPKPPPPRAETKPAEPAPAGKQTEAKAGAPAGHEEAPSRDAYSAAADRWKARSGGGLGGTDGGSGPVGAGGDRGGGGQLVALEFLAYRQQVINTIKARWTNVIARPGLVAAVRFEIAPDGQVSNIRLAQSSGNPAYDASAMRAVQHASQLPPPPARYANDFHEFIIEFHSEESGGQGAG